jgi:putative heme-binding domain-containing protein
MNSRRFLVIAFAGALVLASVRTFPAQEKQQPRGIPERTPWTTSNITGTPEPPLPYKLDRAFAKLTFNNPLLLATAPGSNRFFVLEQHGKLFSFPIDENVAAADLVIDFKKLDSFDKDKARGIGETYGLAFHPQFAKNRHCYVHYFLSGNKGDLKDGTRISRFTMTNTDPPRIDPKSEKIIFTWPSGGHNGCDLHFGPDGFLYISTGDGAGPNPPDGLAAGQDMTTPLSKILRIDIDREENGKAYAIPHDNPFVKTPGARGETWAYGFRNPWRMSFDRVTGDLWVGDVGWEQYEMIYRIQRGGNYGWSIMEGPQPVRTEARRGPTPILPPAIALPHTESASITGGYVYRGKKLKELQGVYIFGDWTTRKVWGTRFDGDKIVEHKELASGGERVVAFGEDHDKELYIVSHDDKGGIFRLVPNDAVKNYKPTFPKMLSETGLLVSAKDHAIAPGVVPFSINAEQWADHATAERFVAVKDSDTIKIYDSQPPWPNNSGEVYFPKDGVLVKTLSLEMERGNPKSRRRLETQILHFDGLTWQPYSYAWNEEQTDATLVGAKGMDRTFHVIDAKTPGKKREQRWHYPSRTECLTCHNPWSGYTLAFNPAQLNRDHDYIAARDNQLRSLEHVNLIAFRQRNWKTGDEKPRKMPTDRLTNPFDASGNLEDRARSYLHANCSHCHQFGAGGTALIDLRFQTSTERAKMLGERPLQGTFEIAGANIIAPGDPFRSVLYYRMAKLGPGRMPHIGSEIVDERGLRLMQDWIRQIHPRKDERALLEKLRVPGANAKERTAAVQQMLSSTSTALMLASAIGENQVNGSVRDEILKAALASKDASVRDLFERFVPDELRPKRLGNVISAPQILAREGNAERGKELFFKSAGLQCANCHRIAGVGNTMGPDLSDIGRKYTKAQILESILEPSKFIDPKFVSYLVETNDGKAMSGLLASKSDKEVILKMAGDKELRIPANNIDRLVTQQKSIMPELLFRDVTLEQAADLLTFLAGLK